MSDPLQQLAAMDQAIWLDSIRRSYLGEGAYLDRLISAGEIKGLTSNPSIFAAAVASGDDYSQELDAHAGGDPREALWDIMIADVTSACDAFAELHRSSDGHHGQVSIEVDPHDAFDTTATVQQARRLWETIDRPNLMVKVPGTEPGLEAIRTLISEGISVNVTLLFSVPRYERVIEAYKDGIRARHEAGEDVSRVASVASFFVSRVDAKVDAAIGDQDLPDTVAIANARVAYGAFESAFGSQDWTPLREAGARVQRPLWASTSTKNDAYPDTLYVEQLAGPNTINTMPEETLDATRDHADIADRITGRADEAREQLDALQAKGVDLDQLTKELETEGVEKFESSFTDAVETVRAAIA